MKAPATKNETDGAELHGELLRQVDSAFHDMEESLRVVGHLLDLYQGLPDAIGPMPPDVCGAIGWLVEQERRRFREAVDRGFRQRREALGFPADASEHLRRRLEESKGGGS